MYVYTVKSAGQIARERGIGGVNVGRNGGADAGCTPSKNFRHTWLHRFLQGFRAELSARLLVTR